MKKGIIVGSVVGVGLVAAGLYAYKRGFRVGYTRAFRVSDYINPYFKDSSSVVDDYEEDDDDGFGLH